MKVTLKNILLFLCISFMLLSFMGCATQSKATPPKVTYNFTENEEGWKGEFVDLPVNYENEADYELEFQHTEIPDIGEKGVVLKGHNRSDDLFMYIHKKFEKNDGLKENTKYNVKVEFDLATNVPGGMMGIGGSPGSSVYVKAGVTNKEPKVEEKDGYRRINIDKGQQSNSGSEMEVLGNIEKEDSQDETYQYKKFEKTFQVTTNDKGQAWVIIGTDSGFEGLTKLYYKNIKVEFDEAK